MATRPEFLSGGEPARLIPITADSAREQKSISVLLAGMRSVLELRQALLKSIGTRVGSSATLEAWTEVVFANEDKKTAKQKTTNLTQSLPSPISSQHSQRITQ